MSITFSAPPEKMYSGDNESPASMLDDTLMMYSLAGIPPSEVLKALHLTSPNSSSEERKSPNKSPHHRYSLFTVLAAPFDAIKEKIHKHHEHKHHSHHKPNR